MNRAYWLVGCTALAAGLGCSKPAPAGEEVSGQAPAPPAAVEAPSPEAPAAGLVQAGPPPAAVPDVVPDTDEAWLAFADGKVQAVDGDGTRDLAIGDVIEAGTVVTADADGQAEIDFPDGSSVDLDAMSELLIQTVSVDGDLRRIELSLLTGAARVTAAQSSEPGSVFRLATPLGTTEVRGTEFAVEVSAEGDLASVVVVEGVVAVQAEAETTDVAATAQGPAVVEVKAGAPIAVVAVPPPVLLERWIAWNERMADRLILMHGIDLAAVDLALIPALDPAKHPRWRLQIERRRTRLAARVEALVEALKEAPPQVEATPRTRFEAAIVVHAAKVAAVRTVVAEAQAARLERWTARAEIRVEQHAALRTRLVENRAAHREWRQRHGRPAGPAVEVNVVVPPPPRVEVGVPAAGVDVSVSVPGVRVRAPAVDVQLPAGVQVRGVRVGPPGPQAPPPPAVVGNPPPGPPPPAVVEQHEKGGGHGHGRNH